VIGLVVFVGLLSGGDCLSAGIDAAQRKDWGEAFRAFRAARARPGCDTPPLIFNLARAGEKVVEGGDGRLACEVAERYTEFMTTKPSPALAKLAVEGRAKMARICAVRSAPPPPRFVPPVLRPVAPQAAARAQTISNALEWGLTTGAVVTTIGAAFTYALALGRIDERDAARDVYIEVRARGDSMAAADAQLDFEQHRDAARTLGITSYVLGGTALALTGLAIWAWAEDDAAGHAIIAPGFMGWGGHF
jgi:hypothetical protein